MRHHIGCFNMIWQCINIICSVHMTQYTLHKSMHQTQIFDPKKNTFFSEMLHKLNILHWKKPFFQKKSTKKKLPRFAGFVLSPFLYMVVVGIPQISMERLLVSPPVPWRPETFREMFVGHAREGGKAWDLDYGLIRHEMWYMCICIIRYTMYDILRTYIYI